MSDIIRATVRGKSYEIPGIWVAGIRTTNPGLSIPDAVDWWAYMAELDEQETTS